MMKKYYDVLGLKEGASKEEIEEKYNQLCLELDPEKNDNQEFFKEEFQKVQEAYRVLIKEAILAKTSGKTKNVNFDLSNSGDSSENNSSKKPNKSKKKISKEFVVIILVLVLLAHNFYLQIQISDVSRNAEDAADYASSAADYASDAADKASNAAYYASDAADYASDAADYASEAADQASSANYNSFANQCSYCP